MDVVSSFVDAMGSKAQVGAPQLVAREQLLRQPEKRTLPFSST